MFDDAGVFLARSSFSHTYAAPTDGDAPWIATLTHCCRKVTNENNAKTLRTLQTIVDLAHDSSPIVPFLPSVRLTTNSPNQSFVVAALASNGHTVTIVDGAAGEYGSAYAGRPSSVTIESATGRVRFNTSNVPPGEYDFIAVVRDEANGLTSSLEVAFVVVEEASVTENEAPYWADSSSSDLFYVAVGERFGLNLTAVDVDPGDNMTIWATTSLPRGAEIGEPRRVYGVRNTGK